MDTTNAPIKRTAINYGAIIGGILIFLVIVMYATGMLSEGVQWPMYIYYAIFPFLIGMAVSAYRSANGGYLTLGQALKVGVTAAVFGGLLYVIYNFVFVYLIEPGFTEVMLENAEVKMLEQNPDMTQEQLDMAMAITEKFSNPAIFGAFWIVMSAFFGFIYSLFSGLIFKRDRPIVE